jgi:hypothetical protein
VFLNERLAENESQTRHRNLPKLRVEGSIPFTRSNSSHFVFRRNLGRPPALFFLRRRSCSMEVGGWFWMILDVLGAVILAAALIYGTAMWRRRPKRPAAQRARDEAVRENYRRGG